MRSYFLSDEELGKKDDDHKHHKHAGPSPASWQPARSPRRRLLKRVLIAGVFVGLVFLFIHNMPAQLGPSPGMRRPSYREQQMGAGSAKRPLDNNGRPNSQSSPSQVAQDVEQIGKAQQEQSTPQKPSLTSENGDEPLSAPGTARDTRSYNGPLKFPSLAISLKAIGATKGNVPINKNVLFAVSSLKSAATLLPMACEMAAELRSYVHVAIMGRSDIHLHELKSINGVDEGCSLIFHDARPDLNTISTESRMEKASFRAFHHIHTYVHPQAIFIDASSDEDSFFLRGARQQSDAVGNTLIEMPSNSARKLSWVSKLNAQALRMWNKITIDILIQATPGTAGGLVRLLKSLSEADYSAGSLPHITIELPHDIDVPTKRYLESFSWPPRHVHNPFDAHLLTLRHRIPSKRHNEDEMAARFMESFWPANPALNDVVLLSPQAEVSGNWYHYIKFAILANRFQASIISAWDKKLFGISLGQPQQLLDGKTSFSPPKSTKTIWQDGKDRDVVLESYLGQVPASDAMLIMGDKWAELHDLVSRTLSADAAASDTHKVVSKQYPSWLEHATRLCRARGYWTLYPGERMARELIGMHGELSRAPEEYAHVPRPKKGQGTEEQGQQLLADDASETEVEEARRRLKAESDVGFTHTALLTVLPNQGHVIPLPELPIVSWDGQVSDFDGSEEAAAKFAAEFRSRVGGCAKDDGSDVPRAAEGDYSTRDLFCVKAQQS
ncbi:hypothetical protein Micbo1qcDRAFT_233477 [Microdochium bolleyi]|uniref:Uncharacterized protein n=1 Tax=Microdochium bolleyi TaxID=196109 RepID=A0A136J4U6_9PEZI|nr:hypothetical protein Micbo1qcDRAFT_233477 [Microdochium bolleyi]